MTDYAALTYRSRREQGLGDRVEDDVVLARVAALVARRDDADPASEIGTTGSCSTIPGHRDATGGRRASQS